MIHIFRLVPRGQTGLASAPQTEGRGGSEVEAGGSEGHHTEDITQGGAESGTCFNVKEHVDSIGL